MTEESKETPKEEPNKPTENTGKPTESSEQSKQSSEKPTEGQEASKETAVEKSEEKKEEEPEKPKPKEYTPEEIEEISKRVETYSNQTPEYKPKHVLSPEYQGTSNYEQGINIVREELEEKLSKLKQNPQENELEIRRTEEDLKKLDNLYENFNLGMNVFRTAHGGRAKLRE